MSTSAEILCSRCGTPFPMERGKPAVTCVVCGQLRPDLDLTLDDDDDDIAGALGTGAAGASLKAATPLDQDDEPAPAPTHIASPPSSMMSSNSSPSTPLRIDQMEANYVSMSERPDPAMAMPSAPGDSISERLGPVLLIVGPLASGMLGALKMLSYVEDFSKGSWYAVGTVFVAMVLGTLIGGIIASGILFHLRLRWTFILRIIYLAVAVFVTWYGMTELPNNIQVRENDFPGIIIRR